MQVKCNKCGYVGDESEFPKGRDFGQKTYVAKCAKGCGNRQSPGNASMRMFGGVDHPFVYVREDAPECGTRRERAIIKTLHAADEAS